MNKEKFGELWQQHKLARFPVGYGGQYIHSICVTTVDTNATGCISSYVKRGAKSLDLDRVLVLMECRVELELLLKYLEGEASYYFCRLLDLCEHVLGEIDID